jgi:hypothetical protein
MQTNLQIVVLNPGPKTLDPKPWTLNPGPQTLDPAPYTVAGTGTGNGRSPRRGERPYAPNP